MAKACGGCANPYNAAHYRQLKDAQRKIADLIPLIDKLDKCGAECDTFRAVAADLQTRLSALEREFMNPPPAR